MGLLMNKARNPRKEYDKKLHLKNKESGKFGRELRREPGKEETVEIMPL